MAAVADEEDEDGEGDADPWLHANGYAKDDFVVSDEEAEEDAFAPRFSDRRPPPRRRQQTLDDLGPPISRDSRIDEARLDEIHQDIVHAFAERASELDESLRNKHGLRRSIFTEQQHREMAIRWTTTVHQMYTIRGVDKTKVDLYGARFAALVRQFYTQYQEMMGGNAAKPFSAVVSAAETQRRDRDLINLVSDDEDNAEDRNTGSGRAFRFGDEQAEEEASEGGIDEETYGEVSEDEENLEASRYFDEDADTRAPSEDLAGAAATVREWHKRFGELKKASRLAQAAPSSNGGDGNGPPGASWRSGKKSYFPKNRAGRGGSSRSGGGGSNGSFGRANSTGGVTKRKGSVSRQFARGNSSAGNGRGRPGPGSKRSGGGAGGGAGSGIPSMPY